MRGAMPPLPHMRLDVVRPGREYTQPVPGLRMR